MLHLVLVARHFDRRPKLLTLHLVVTLYWWRIVNIYQIVLIKILYSKIAIAAASKVDPLYELSDTRRRRCQIDLLFLFCIEESVSKEEFFAFKVRILLMNVVPVDCHGSHVARR